MDRYQMLIDKTRFKARHGAASACPAKSFSEEYKEHRERLSATPSRTAGTRTQMLDRELGP